MTDPVTVVKTDVAAAETAVAGAETKATSWLVAHAHAFVTGALVVAVLYILHVIL